MSKLKNKLSNLKKDEIAKKWENIQSREGLSTKEKLEKLVKLSVKREKKQEPIDIIETSIGEDETFLIKEFSYPIDTGFGKVKLAEWLTLASQSLSIIVGDDFSQVDPGKLVFFDTETTGLSGGTGTIPFLIGFGYFENDIFRVTVFILNDLYGEEEFLNEVDSFLEKRNFSGTVTFNGKSFDFPLMETRYILYRKRFPLLKLPHLDFLFPARTLWKHTYESRRLAYLGDVLLGLSRDDDIESSQIPALYFSYLRNHSFDLIEKVIEHNALDILGLAALVLLGVKYLEDISFTSDEGEILGTALLYEKAGNVKRANELYTELKNCAVREDVKALAIKRSSFIMKRKKLFDEAVSLWQLLSPSQDKSAARELAMHFEHREKNYTKALEFVQKGLESASLTDLQRKDFEKRWQRLIKKIKALKKEEEPEKG